MMNDLATLYQVLALAEKHVAEIKALIAARDPLRPPPIERHEEYRNADTNGNY